MGLIGRHGRILLAVVPGALTVFLLARTLLFYDRATAVPPGPGFPRIQQAAGIIDLAREVDPALRPAVLRALDGVDLRVAIAPEAPTDTAGFQRAPHIEEKVREFAAPGIDGDLAAYTDAAYPQRASGTEGLPARIVWHMPDGKALVITFIERSRPATGWNRVPPGFLVGVSGLVIAGLALVLTQRDTRLLHRLALAAEAFDGAPPPSISAKDERPDMRRLAGSVEAMQRRVATLLQERSFLIGAISHDLKTYLTRVRLRTENFPDPDQRDRMASDLEAMTDLIDTSLAFARGTTVTQHKSLVDLADLAAIEAAERVASGQQVTAVDREGDAMVLGDPVALRRVLANLVDNALKYGRGRVEIRVGANGSMYDVAVDDDGPGVTEAEQAAIFSPFYRIEGSRNRRTGGNGLGLAIARQIVEAHGGIIAVAKSPLGGARFTVCLPTARRA